MRWVFSNCGHTVPLPKRYFDYLQLKTNMWDLNCQCDRCPELRRGPESCIPKVELEVISRNVRERLSGRRWSFSPTLSQFDDKSTYTRAVFDSLGVESVWLSVDVGTRNARVLPAVTLFLLFQLYSKSLDQRTTLTLWPWSWTFTV